ncbi:outer membrane beta-barrel family protein [Pedobacter nyackensis]|uniref:Outer membrane receptor proteins, mostly Fe transport n=1 Tax=Pedobacter nyackensis TaxID=475255 RepID=A0A1W2AQ64_9SPHI|nr:outer membrane beta-barrel family protein [Pedobacter nyackensis]SMC62672.1 Outer membrane receptor proteins, mostly Fe transport [Pedobacter nyackensis]
MKFKHAIIRLIIISTALFTKNITVFGQTSTDHHINGIVADSATKHPLPMVTVRLKKANNETVQIMVTQGDGSFKFSAVIPALYTLSVEAIGYGFKTISVDLIRFRSKTIDLQSIYLGDSMVGLKEVAITGDRPVIRRKADRIIYDLKADPESKINNVLTMMRKIPYLSVDGDDNLLMKGNSSFKVLINGKPSGSLEGNLKAVLKSIPASTLESIEVITTPPSKYDAEGLAGIINIITSKKINDGFNGSVNVNESFPIGGPGIGGVFTAKSGRFGVAASGGGSIYHSPKTFNTNKRVDAIGITLEQEGNQRSTNKTAYFGIELSYLVDTLNLLTAQLNYNLSRVNDHSAQASELRGLNGFLQQYGFENENKASSYGIDAGFNYEMGFKAMKNRLLTFSYLFGSSLNDKNGGIMFDHRVNFTTPDFLQTDHHQFKEHTFQVDFVTPVKKLNIEAGIKGILRKNTSDFDYSLLNTAMGQYERTPLLSNSFSNTQNVFSAYNSYRLILNSWNISAGIRFEETVISADFSGTTSLAEQNYFNILPSVAIGKGFKNGTSINFGFSQRIRRPGINRLNPYVDRSNPNYEVTGNPDLRPVLLNNLQFGYGSNKKLSINIGLDYSFMNNLDLQVVNFNPATQISRVTYANTGKSSSSGGNFNLSYPVSSCYNASLNGNAMYLWLSGQDNGQPVKNDLLLYAVILSNVVRLSHGWALNADVGLNSRNPTGLQGYTNGFFYNAFNFNKEIIKDKFSIGGGIKNPFTKYRNRVNTTFGPQFSQVFESRNYFRSFNFNLNYNFGGLKDRINKNRVGIKNSDIAR